MGLVRTNMGHPWHFATGAQTETVNQREYYESYRGPLADCLAESTHIGETLIGDTYIGVGFTAYSQGPGGTLPRQLTKTQYVDFDQTAPGAARLIKTYSVPEVEEWLMLHADQAAFEHGNGGIGRQRYRKNPETGGPMEGWGNGVNARRWWILDGEPELYQSAHCHIVHGYVSKVSTLEPFSGSCGHANSVGLTYMGELTVGSVMLTELTHHPVLFRNRWLHAYDAVFMRTDAMYEHCTIHGVDSALAPKPVMLKTGKTGWRTNEIVGGTGATTIEYSFQNYYSDVGFSWFNQMLKATWR